MFEIDFNKMPCIYWSKKQKVNWLQRYIIIHSLLYYDMSENVIMDFQFDGVSKQLVRMQKELGKEIKETDYYYIFKDFDGSTGFYIKDRLTKKDRQYLTNVANIVLKNYKRGKN